MKHMIKKTMLTGALSCFLLGTALADDATNQPAKSLPLIKRLPAPLS